MIVVFTIGGDIKGVYQGSAEDYAEHHNFHIEWGIGGGVFLDAGNRRSGRGSFIVSHEIVINTKKAKRA